MCSTNNWKSIEAKIVPDDLTKFELIAMRSDGVLIMEPISIGANLGGTIARIVEQINNFESFRNCACSSTHVCVRHSVTGDNNS